MHLCKSMKKNLSTLILVLSTLALAAQERDAYVNFHNIMDNREYKHTVGYPQTIMGARLDFALGLKADSLSGLYAGLNYMYLYGAAIDSITPTLNLYYEIDRENFAFYAGSFPRQKLFHYPKLMFSDSISYFNPNISGMALEVRRPWGTQAFFADWRGQPDNEQRESFAAGFAGSYHKQSLYIENYGYMYHYVFANAYNKIQDNGMGALFVGYDFSTQSKLEILKIDLGAIANYNRIRPEDYAFYGGAMLRLNAHFPRYGIDLNSYWGQRLYNPLGDQLYKNGHYTRLDLCAIPIVGEHIETVFKWSLHFTGGELSNSQQFFLIAHF